MNSKKLFEKYVNKLDSLKDKEFKTVSDELFSGKNVYIRSTKKGSSMFDPSWIDVIEDCLYDLGEIINNPREVTSSESNVVPIELAKKVNGESVQHLASHAQYIKDITETGDVIPAKILSHFNKEELHTYENRFIATFVRRLVLFIEKRYEFIKSTVSLDTHDVLILKNTSMVNGQEVEIETKITVKKENVDDVSISAKEYIERIAAMREYITFYYNSPFMKEMKTEKDVRKPILQTNIIRKNPLYRKCFETFTFIENFESLGVSYKIDETYHSYTEEERKRINYLLVSQFLAIQDGTELAKIRESKKVYKPKVLSSRDDEKFIYGDLYQGPIEFVRVDEGYKKYLASLIKEDLAIHPKKMEKEFYEQEYAQKRNILLQIKEIDKLIARKNKEIDLYEKEVQKIIAKRDQEEIEEAKKRQEKLRKQQESLLNEKRRLIVLAAKSEVREIKAENKAKENQEIEEVKEPIDENILVNEEEIELQEITPEPKSEIIDEPVMEENNEPEQVPAEENVIQEEEPVSEESTEQVEEPATVEEKLASEPENEPVVEEEQPEVQESEDNSEEITEEPVNEEPLPEVKEEGPVVEEPKLEEEKAEKPAKKPAAKKARKAKQPKEEENVPQEEENGPVIEEVLNEPHDIKEEQPKIDVPLDREEPKKKAAPHKKHKKEPIPEVINDIDKEVVSPKEKKPRRPKEQMEVIPGRFIVKTPEGYFVNRNKYVNSKSEAHIFNDFNKANQMKKLYGGKVVKL